MPVEGLPLVLENALIEVMDTSVISSWTLRGGDDFSQVTIRFKMAASSAKQAQVKYRKEPPSRTRRDMKRAQRNKDNTSMIPNMHYVDRNSPGDSYQNVNIADDTTVNLSTAGISLSPMQNTFPTLSPVAQVDGPLDSACGLQQGDQTPVETSTDSGDNIDLQQPAYTTDSGATNELHQPLPDPDNGATNYFKKEFVCSSCGIDIASGKRCLLCANVYMCERCFSEGFHQQVPNSLCKFVIGDFDVDNVPNEPHCMGCFKTFSGETSLFKCASCQRYLQCSKCQINCLHHYHRNYLQEIPFEDIT